MFGCPSCQLHRKHTSNLVAGVIGVLDSHTSQPKDENKQETWASIPENAAGSDPAIAATRQHRFAMAS